jgi:hypothetical protein
LAEQPEIAYFAQLHPNYELLGRRSTDYSPTGQSDTRRETAREDHGTIQSRFWRPVRGERGIAPAKLSREVWDHNTAVAFDETESVINQQLERLRESLVGVDPTLAEALKGGREKILYQIHNLRDEIYSQSRSSRRSDAAAARTDVDGALSAPESAGESSNICYFLARYGYTLIDQIYERIDVGMVDHRLMMVG